MTFENFGSSNSGLALKRSGTVFNMATCDGLTLGPRPLQIICVERTADDDVERAEPIRARARPTARPPAPCVCVCVCVARRCVACAVALVAAEGAMLQWVRRRTKVVLLSSTAPLFAAPPPFFFDGGYLPRAHRSQQPVRAPV
jgi:hypothetical protein